MTLVGALINRTAVCSSVYYADLANGSSLRVCLHLLEKSAK